MDILQTLKRHIPSRIKTAAKVLVYGDRRLPTSDTRSWFQNAAHQIQARGLFVGCPISAFELSSKDLFCLALVEGLQRSSSTLEIGCGCLRTGYHFISHLDAGRYCGIEPNVVMLNAGRELILSRLEREKAPRFSDNADFDLGGFNTTFDFVVAFSVWTHASKGQIATMLDEFKRNARPGGKLITSWIPPREGIPDYHGQTWVGRSHRSNQPGMVAHSREWLTETITSQGLGLTFFRGFTTLDQHWLIITRP